MNRVKVTQEINVYEVDDETVSTRKEIVLEVMSHWNWDNFVRLKFEDKSITVSGQDLKTAINNAMNTGLI